MTTQIFPQSGLPIRRTLELLPQTFQTDANSKFMSAVLDPLVQPGTLQKTVGYVGRRYGKTYKSSDIYLDTDQTLRSRYQLEPGVVVRDNDRVINFYDYIDFKNQLKFFGNTIERDDKITEQSHYSWNPPIDWDKFVNFREYYWVPDGPPPIVIEGQRQAITSTYKVRLASGVESAWLFFPDGFTNNPTITLYRGQTYKFQINSANEGFVIKTNYDVGSLLYKPFLPYNPGQLAIFDNKLWRAKTFIPITEGSTITEESQDWEYVEPASQASSLEYNVGVTNNGIANGTITFTVPLDAPDVLYYQSSTDINRFGKFIIADVSSNTKIDITKEIIGKTTYTSSNGITLSNGMKIRFSGQVTPEKYSSDTWIVEGVGDFIELIRFQDLTTPFLSVNNIEILFDNEGFDTQPFDDAANYPSQKDYITINRSSQDSNSWSRYNRWFHKDVLEQAFRFNNSDFDSLEDRRAKRPIIEFKPHLKLFNHGEIAKQAVDFIDTFTQDVFSTIEGSLGYNVDGEELFDGARLLIVADTDILVKNKIYTVNFITHNGRRQINLREAEDSISAVGDCVLIKRGNQNRNSMYHYDGENWIKSQAKTSVNQSPLFDVFDKDYVSFGAYSVSSFVGSKILSYKTGNGVNDTELGFSLSYLNIDNVGDIEFNFDWDTETFTYQVDRVSKSINVATGFYKFTKLVSYGNNWIETDKIYLQPIIDSTEIVEDTNVIEFETIDWNNADLTKIQLYVNGQKIFDPYVRDRKYFIFNKVFSKGDIITIKIFGNVEPKTGYYEIPVGLEKNPLNQEIKSFTLGQAVDHVSTALDVYDDFVGNYPGNSNLRDISGYQNLGKRFLKHSNLTPTSIMLLCDKDVNVIKSIQYAKRSYSNFKDNFIKLAANLDYDDNPVDFVDTIIASMTKIKSESDPFSDSDMVGCGAFTKKDYIVDDIGIKTFALSEKFSLNELNRKAVYIYLNNVQLIYKQDYDFNSSFGFVEIKVDLNEGDNLQIREYVSTGFCFIPPTPTKLGLYKKYLPQKFLDNTYQEPVEVIQGHDGSITKSYGDFRDDVLLELEKRIYNNIKQEYNEDIYNIDLVFGNYYYKNVYSKQDLDLVLSSEFLRWLVDTNIDYSTNTFLDTENAFTYTYTNMTDPTGSENLPGWWRGVYRYFYDTDRPHTHPWEMLGFSEQPDWWENQYGPAPYTSGNLLLWEDLRDGIIRQGSKAGTYERYKRNTILSHLPVDGDGNLLDPLNSGLAQDFSLYNNRGNFKFGDEAPVESAWRRSSEYPYSIIHALCLLRPFDFIIEASDRSRVVKNSLGQKNHSGSNSFIKNSDLIVPQAGVVQTSGLFNFIVDFLKSKGLDYTILREKIDNLDVNLSTRLSGFVDQAQQKYVLDSKNPKSNSSSIFIPPENYDINFNISSPISSPTYSGVIVEKLEDGFKIYGYDIYDPFFLYYRPLESENSPVISVGGVSENFTDWEPNKTYNNGSIVRQQETFYRCIKTHTSGTTLDLQFWQKLPKVPLINATEVLKRSEFDLGSTKKLAYGTVLKTLQEVADFIFGYDFYLRSIGYEFNQYDSDLEVSKDWITSIKEFLFWTKHKWAPGSLITLSPAASKIEFNFNVGVADNLLDSFYDYNILKEDGTILPVEFINVNRDFRKLTVETTNTTDGIYFFKCYFVIKEHVTIFSDRTVFNDVIYDKPTGYRQERIKSRGFRTVDWDGDYTSPGFLFDNVNIQTWQPFVDYKLGDIVNYKSYNWTSLVNQQGQEIFDETKWSKLDSRPVKGLITNFDVKVSQFEDYYNADADGITLSQRDLARHIIGYQNRDYLQNLAEDQVTQFKLYQGFIREKGTANSVVKIFDKLSRIDADSVVLNEEWAFRVGRLGGLDQLYEIEFEINKGDLLLNPQPIISIQGTKDNSNIDRYIRVNEENFTRSLIPFSPNINPVKKYDSVLKNAGYVNKNHVDVEISVRDELLNLDITTIKENSHIWVTFDGPSWTVLRFNLVKDFYITEIETLNDRSVLIQVNKEHQFTVDEIIGIQGITNLTGFFKILEVTPFTFRIQVTQPVGPVEIDNSTLEFNIYKLIESRFDNYQSISTEEAALLKVGSKLWIDNSDQDLGNWEVVEKQQLYNGKLIKEFGTTYPESIGLDVIYIENLKETVTGIPKSGIVVVYSENSQGLKVKQILYPETGLENVLANSFGTSLAVSPDNKWLAIGAPLASGVLSRFRGWYNANETYVAGDIVLHKGQLWEAIDDQIYQGFTLADDGSTQALNILNEKFKDTAWKPAEILFANVTGDPGPTQQGMVTLYRYENNTWNFEKTIISPRPAPFEKFGSKISIAVSGVDYYMSISAPGALDNTGRVYLYKFTGSSSRTDTQILEFFGTEAIDYNLNTITFSRDHNFPNGQPVLYINGTFNGSNKSSATSPPPPEDFSVFYVIRIDDKTIQLTATALDAAQGTNIIDLKDIGIDDSSSHTLTATFTTGWKHLEDINYRGIYDSTLGTGSIYRRGSKVWHNGKIYEALEDVAPDGSTLDLSTSHSWKLLDDISTQNSLPTNVALEDENQYSQDDSSTLQAGDVYPLISAKEIIPGEIYSVETFGTTDFTSLGLNLSAGNLIFKSTGFGHGTGTVRWRSYRFAELIKSGDKFGSSLAMNGDGSILVVGAPESDGKYFTNYRGLWTSYSEYNEGDVVKYNGVYYQLKDTVNDSVLDSTYILTSINQIPTLGNPWFNIDSELTVGTGKIFIYQKNSYGVYRLLQTICNDNLAEINDTKESLAILTADKFGSAVDIDLTGTTIVVSAPFGDAKQLDQGFVYVLKTNNLNNINYRIKQKLISYEKISNEQFGSSLAISGSTERIVVGAKNSPFNLYLTFDSNTTTFDNSNTRFYSSVGSTGQVYVFERKDQTYHLTEKLYDETLQDWESFGSSVDATASVIAVGSPTYRSKEYRRIFSLNTISGSNTSLVVGATLENGSIIDVVIRDSGTGYLPGDEVTILGSSTNDNAVLRVESIDNTGFITFLSLIKNGSGYVTGAEIVETGQIRLFSRDPNKNSWNTLLVRNDLVDIDLIKNISIYDNVKNIKLSDIDVIDHHKLKILGVADQEIKFKTLYDPAVYTNGTTEQEVDSTQAWFENQVGNLWWDLSTAKWIYHEQDDISYRIGNCNQLAYGATIDIYEWVESRYLPSQWSVLADTTEGISQGISGQPLYPDDSVYSVKVLTNPSTGEPTLTKYFYWVKNKDIIPRDVVGRKISAASVKNYIENPIGSGIPFITPIAKETLLAYNFESLIDSNIALVNIQYKKNQRTLNPIHNEYQLISEGVADSLPTGKLEEKWIDSLVGYDNAGNSLPDLSIPYKQRYGIEFRPRQSMFIDRFAILRTVLININTILNSRAFADTLNLRNLNLVDSPPSEQLNEYDVAVDTLIDLEQVGTIRVKKAELRPIIVNGEIDGVEIVDPGFGYKVTPFIEIEGDGIGAEAQITLDNQGRVNSVTMLSKGRKYTSAVVQIRPFSVLVNNDESLNGNWSIYAWDSIRKIFFRLRSQAFNTPKFWEYKDWWKQEYGTTSRIVKEIGNLYEEPEITVEIGDLIRVKEFGSGGWAVLEKTNPTLGNILDNYALVGRENGTIQLKINDLLSPSTLGYDNVISFDSNLYDLQPTAELRNILRAVKEDLFIEDLAVEWNKLFFTCVRYAFVEQPYIDWAFKTSFLNATHNVGNLEQKFNYKNDNLDSFKEYLEEVKPYRTTIREYTSKYLKTDNSGSAVTDFDLPPAYNTVENKILPIDENNQLLNVYPYKWWTDNLGYSVKEILVSDPGNDYVEIPRVLIEGNGSGATAQAFIANGKVVGIKVLTSGQGYTKTPTVSIVGGNTSSQNIAKAVAIIDNSPVRTFDLTMKFDRISKTGYYENFTNTETFVANGFSAVFDLKFAPNRNKNSIIVVKNNQIILSNEYTITLYQVNNGSYTILKGKLIFNITPNAGDIIEINYEKNSEILDSVNRIQKFYNPTVGMKGKDLPQLMTGIDFGGVQIQGTTFDVTGGWDALPWFTDSWDSVESNSDFYYIADGSTTTITLPYVPALNEEISVYIKRKGNRIPSDITTIEEPLPRVVQTREIPENRTVRIDDPNWTPAWDSSNVTNPYAQMPTFVGDGQNNIVEIGQYISVQPGDTLIFRKLDSDGSVTITDVNLLDTRIVGGSFSIANNAYVTATGITPEEIIVDGEKFISPDQVPAPEENLPGQVLESLSIKVYQNTPQGASPLQSSVFTGDSFEVSYPIGLTILDTNSVLVYVNKIQKNINTDYTLNFVTNSVIFNSAPLYGAVIEIIAIGIGGVNLLDYQEFEGDGETNLFLTKALYDQTTSVVVTVDGVQIDTSFIESSELTDTANRTLIRLGFSPNTNSIVKIVCLGAALNTDSSNQSLVRVNKQISLYDGSTTQIELDKFVDLFRASAVSSILVSINGTELKGPETSVIVYDGTNNIIEIGRDPLRSPGSITYSDLRVYVNYSEITRILDYTLNTSENIVTVKEDILNQGDVVIVVITSFSDYLIEDNNLILSDNLVPTLSLNDKIEIIWFSEYPTLQMITDEFSGGKVQYQLSRKPINPSYVWVYVNGNKLTNLQDYSVSIERGVVYLAVPTTDSDLVKIVEFGNEIWSFPNAFEIYKDMLNVYQFKRFSKNDVKLATDLHYYDTIINVTNGDDLYDPTNYRNVPGVLWINGERIEYLRKTGNVLSQLRRGSFGSAIKEIHNAGTVVADISPLENLPYNETQHRQDFVSDGSTILVGPLDFTPSIGSRSTWFRSSIPEGYGPCDQIEVFVAGTRLRKNPIDVYDESLGSNSNEADKKLEAEFSVDGINPYIRLTSAVPAGTRITVIRRTGKIWYEPGENTASAGKTLSQNDTAIAKFILAKTTIIPE